MTDVNTSIASRAWLAAYWFSAFWFALGVVFVAVPLLTGAARTRDYGADAVLALLGFPAVLFLRWIVTGFLSLRPRPKRPGS